MPKLGDFERLTDERLNQVLSRWVGREGRRPRARAYAYAASSQTQSVTTTETKLQMGLTLVEAQHMSVPSGGHRVAYIGPDPRYIEIAAHLTLEGDSANVRATLHWRRNGTTQKATYGDVEFPTANERFPIALPFQSVVRQNDYFELWVAGDASYDLTIDRAIVTVKEI